MNIIELRDYDYWVGKNAQSILYSVYAHGGWDNVFPQNGHPFPLWLSRVRNYFNYYPKMLKILDLAKGEQRSRMENHYHDYRGVIVQKTIGQISGVLQYKNAGSKAKAANALSEYVYKDKAGNYWYQMAPGATGYHFKDSWADFSTDFKAVKSTIKGQGDLPVFKLISPDIAGGSYEIIIKKDEEVIKSWYEMVQNGYDTFHKDAGLTLQAFKSNSNFFTVGYENLVTDYKYEGSYNFSETIKNGFSAHDYRDIKPHRTYPGFYVNPPFSTLQQPLSSRVFPEKDKHRRLISVKPEDAFKLIQGWMN